MRIDQDGVLYYKPGDVVRVLPTPQRKCHGVHWADEMDRFCSKQLTINSARKVRDHYRYSVKENSWYWVNEFLEPLTILSDDDSECDFENVPDELMSFISAFSVAQ